jgi:hypothetical protein
MKRPRLIPAALVALTVGGIALGLAGLLKSPTSSTTPTPQADSKARACEILTSEAGWNYRHSQPTHWRRCLLQP